MPRLSDQQGDVLLRQTPDGGDIDVQNGLVVMSGGLSTSAYLALFGGNNFDADTRGNPFTWWGNVDEIVPERRQRSETQHVINFSPPIPASLVRIEDAVKRDLAYLINTGVAYSVSVAASIPALNRVKIEVWIQATSSPDSDISHFEFIENWNAPP